MKSQNNPISENKQGINKLKDTYLHWTQTQLEKLQGHLKHLEQKNPPKSDQLMTEIFDLSHNIKGLGGNFGYYLITDIAGSLCEYLRDKECVSELQQDIIIAHITAMDMVLSQEIEGSGGEQGNKILEQLNNLINRENSV